MENIDKKNVMSKRATDYNKANTKREVLNMHLEKDKDIIDFLSTVSNKSSYIKELIREDMKRRG
ncbi:MAG: hypothetical protein Q4B60_07130 [Erysipelotrichaceae bacterium]|nr:hypothetical protein [Erysipelotrichaceae bacterium]